MWSSFKLHNNSLFCLCCLILSVVTRTKSFPGHILKYWSDLIHRNVIKLVSIHQKLVYLFFLFAHLKYITFFLLSFLLPSPLLLIHGKKFAIGCIDQLTDVMVNSFTFPLLFAIFSFSLITYVNMLRSLAVWQHSWVIYFMQTLLICQLKDLELTQSGLNWNSILD